MLQSSRFLGLSLGANTVAADTVFVWAPSVTERSWMNRYIYIYIYIGVYIYIYSCMYKYIYAYVCDPQPIISNNVVGSICFSIFPYMPL